MKSIMIGIAFALLLLAGPALACNADADCGAGGKCMKQGGGAGSCMANMKAGSGGASQPAPAQSKAATPAASGKVCRQDSHCSSGQRCEKAAGARAGVCRDG